MTLAAHLLLCAAYLFSYFSNNDYAGRKGEAAGLHLAYSYDGLAWTALNDDRPILEPKVGDDRLMRDPSLCRGPDGVFHLVWTTGWRGREIGYASSRDLVHWSEQRLIPVMADEPTARNCWAPEVTYDPDGELFYIYWSSTIPGRHRPIPDMDKMESGLNHRVYCTTTRDFKTFSRTRLWFNPDYSAIDAAIVRDEKRGDWLFFVKDENHTPVQKDIRMVRVASLTNDIPTATGSALTAHWTEGPSPLFVGDALYLYYDIYRGGRYGALRSLDHGDTWTNVTQELHMPAGMRHGTAIAVDRGFVDQLVRTRWPGAETPKAAAAEPSTNALPAVSLAALTMGAEKVLKYGEKVKVEGELTYLVSDGSDFRLTLDENGELKVVAVPGWWTKGRVATAIAIGVLLFLAALGWAFFLRHQKLAERRMSDAVQKERLRLSHDLHDGYQQLLAGCMFRLTAARTLLGRGNVPKASVQLEGLRGSLTHAQDELRAALWTMTEEAEGPAAISDLFRYAAARLPQWEGVVSFETEGVERPISRRYAGVLLMVLQEAVGNALRHGRSTSVVVRFVFGRKGVAMIVRDNGCGFDVASAPTNDGFHLGMSGMKSRLEKVGGTLAIRSIVGKGTEVKVVLEG